MYPHNKVWKQNFISGLEVWLMVYLNTLSLKTSQWLILFLKGKVAFLPSQVSNDVECLYHSSTCLTISCQLPEPNYTGF